MPNAVWARGWLKKMTVVARRRQSASLSLERAVVLAISCGLSPVDAVRLLAQQDFSWNPATGEVVDRRPRTRRVTPSAAGAVRGRTRARPRSIVTDDDREIRLVYSRLLP